MEKRGLFSDVTEGGSNRSLVSVERGWVYVYGVVLSSYCYVFTFIMSFFFLLSGVLFTAISYRPQEVEEQFGEWSARIAKSWKTRIAGPAFILLGCVMTLSSVVLCLVSRRVNAAKSAVITPARNHEDGDNSARQNCAKQRRLDDSVVSTFSVVQCQEKSYFPNGYSDKSSLIVSDIACFPDINAETFSRTVTV